VMGRGNRETHPWLYDKNNHRRQQHFSDAVRKIHKPEEGRHAHEVHV